MQVPVHSQYECHLVLVDLGCFESRDSAPGTGRVVAILQILGRQDESCEEHAATTLEGLAFSVAVGLFHGEIMARNVGSNQDKVVQGNLKGRVAGAGPAQSFLNETAQREHSTAAHLFASWR